MFPSVIVRLARIVLGIFVALAAIIPGAWGQADVQGQWSTLSTLMPINPIHVALMHNGKILVVPGSGNCPSSQSGCPSGPPYGASINSSGALVLDPVTQNITPLSVAWDTFCNSMTVLADGRVFINGGTLAYDPFKGIQKSSIFDPATNIFTDVQNMAHGRWYPTVILLGDGRVMTFSGLSETGGTNSAVEIYTVGSGWSQQYTASWTPPLYPRLHLLPNGNVFYSGSGPATQVFNPSTHAWTAVASTNLGSYRTYGSSVLFPLTPANNYDPQVMILGGGSSPTATTEIIDLGASSPSWQMGPDMIQPRIEMDAVMLPTGKVLAMGGSTVDENASTAVLNAELFDPANPSSFSPAGKNVYPRLYHTVALLLPDATVWLAGSNPARGNYEAHMEIYQPAYLFTRDGTNNVIAATRPSISSAPGNISWGGQFVVSTPDAANISQAVLVRPGSSTHAFDMDQRLVGMSFTTGSGTLTATAPPNSNIAPPGYYMLFLINNKGVPSVAKFVLLSSSGSNPAPTVGSISPTSGTTAGGTGVTITGTGFLSGATVKIGGTAATGVTVGSSTSITATTPAHAAGTVNVVVTNSDSQSGTLSNGYVYTSSSGGGIAFVQSTTGPSTVQASNTTVAVTYPAAQTAGDLNVVVVGWGNTAPVSSVTDSRGNTYTLAVGPTSGNGLQQSIYYAKNIAAGSNTVTVKFSPAAAYPDVRILEYSGLDPSNPLDVTAGTAGTGTAANSGSASTSVANELIFGAGTSGTSFSAGGTGFTQRMINIYGNIAEDKAVSSPGSYNATATDRSGLWVMQMAAFRASGSGSPPPPPVPTSISPPSGTTAGGTSVTITGTGFVGGAAVKLGGTAATNVNVGGSTSITATTAAHAAGAVDVVVTNSDSQSGTLTQGYTYTTPSNPAPTVATIAPTSGTTAGGTPVTITGTGFLAGATVSLGGMAATGITVVNSTSITATTPAHAAGAVNVVVTNSDGQSGPLANGYAYTSASGGGIAFVQSSWGPPTIQASNTTVAVAYPSAQTAGNLNVVVVGWGDTTSTVSSVTDSKGKVYALAVGPTGGNGLRQSIYYASNIAGGSNTVTVTFNQAAAYPDVRILEYSGLNPSNPLDVVAGTAGTGAAANSGSATTTSANELIFGAGTSGNRFGAAGSGFTLRMINLWGNLVEDKTVSSAGSYNATATDSSGVWVMQMATFKP